MRDEAQRRMRAERSAFCVLHSAFCIQGAPRNARRCVLLLFAGVLMLSAACGGSAPASEADPSEASSTAPTGPDRVNIDEIFPPGKGRDLVLNNCQSCHVWVPIVILQMDEAAWYRNSLEHRGRVAALSDEAFETLYEYLKTNFHPGRPVPELPPALLEAWTSY